MPRFRKSKASRNTPAPTSTSPAELVKKGDSGALATLSAGIALSIGSATDGPGGTSGDTTAVRGPDAILKTTYSAVRMAVEITKESSDLCLPLKAVVGAVFALMKNYDVRMSRPRTKHVLILFLVPVLANNGQCGENEGCRAEGAVAVWRACLSCKRR